MATNDKYDRQLRLWGPNGQRALMESNILLINACAVGTETLKNLVLPGVGRFTVLDNEVVTERDLENNFFVESTSLGLHRARVVTQLLQELNPDVTGTARIANLSSILVAEPNYFQGFNLIIASNVIDTHIVLLSTICHAFHIPLIILRSYGLVGTCRLQVVNHEIIESHPDNTHLDLRLLHPFPALIEYCRKYDISAVTDSMEHAHVPYIVILYKALETYKQQNNDKIPRTYKEKEDFKVIIKSLAYDMNHEHNFIEALRESHRAYASSTLPSDVLLLLENQRDKLLTPQSSLFSYMLRALQVFMESNQHLPPLPGTIPDMTATTTMYTELQYVYNMKAKEDCHVYTTILYDLIQKYGYISSSSSSSLTMMSSSITDFSHLYQDKIDIFCHNIPNLKVISTRTLSEERFMLPSQCLENAVNDPYDDPLQTPIGYYIGLRAAEVFYTTHQRYPGTIDDQLEEDTEYVWDEMQSLVRRSTTTTTTTTTTTNHHISNDKSLECNGTHLSDDTMQEDTNHHMIQDSTSSSSTHSTNTTTSSTNHDTEGFYISEHSLPSDDVIYTCITKDHACEMVRYGGEEIHTISAILGGIASQEAVKLITHQYVCINNTYVYNGIAGVGVTYEF